MFALILLQLLYGFSLPLNKYLLSFCPPIFFSGIRMLVAGLLLLVGCSYSKKRILKIHKEHLWYGLGAIFFGVYLKYILRNWALSFLPPGKVAFMLYLTPFIAGIAAGKATTQKQWAALCIGFLGVIPLVVLKTHVELQTLSWFSFSLPEVAIFAAMVCHITGMFCVQKLIKTFGYSGMVINMARSLVGGCLALATSFYVEGFLPVPVSFKFYGAFFLLIILSNVVCHNLYFSLLKKYSVTFLLFTDFLNPLVTALCGWLFFHETLSWHYAVCAIMMGAGLYLFYQDELYTLQVQKGIL